MKKLKHQGKFIIQVSSLFLILVLASPLKNNNMLVAEKEAVSYDIESIISSFEFEKNRILEKMLKKI